MKKYKLVILVIFLILIIFSIYLYQNFGLKENQNLKININEKIVLSLAIAKNGIISDDSRKFIYDFKSNKIELIINEKYLRNPYIRNSYIGKIDIDSNKYMLNGNFYLNGNKIFECNNKFCSYYKTQNGNYIIFADKMVYKNGFIKKELAFNIIRVLDINTLEYKDFPILEYDGNNFSVSEILGYFN